MGQAMLNVTVVEKRMLNATEAASYCGLPAKHFAATCPEQPVELRPGLRLWDRRDLDRWLDGLKQGTEATTREQILGKL